MKDVRDTNDTRSDYLLLGEVIDNDDPEKRGRVKVLVPGFYEPSSVWCEAMFRMFGVKNGIWWVPEVGSNVGVWLHQGDQDFPFYLPGPFGAPGGVTDVMDQVPDGSVDHLSVRWRDFHVTFNGKAGEEKLTIEDLDSGTKLEIDRPSGGDYLRDVEANEVINVKTNRDVTVEEGDETHTVTAGKRTTTIQGDDDKTIVAGDEIKTLTAGDKTQTLVVGNETKILTLGNSSETMPAGAKVITTGLAITLTAGTGITLLAGGAISITGASVTVNSGGGPSSYLAGGLLTRTFLGGVAETVVGGVISTITGAFLQTVIGIYTMTVTGVLALVAATVNLGSGPTYKPVMNSDLVAAFNAHTHTGVMAGGSSTGGPTTTITPGGTVPFDQNDMVATNVNAS